MSRMSRWYRREMASRRRQGPRWEPSPRHLWSVEESSARLWSNTSGRFGALADGSEHRPANASPDGDPLALLVAAERRCEVGS